MRLLQRNFDVKTRYGGGFVQQIDGVAGGREGGRRVDWFYYVNGIEVRRRRRRAPRRRRRPHLVGPPRLGRRDAHPGRRRLVPRAVPVRRRAASASRSGSTARAAPSAPCDEVATRLETRA